MTRRTRALGALLLAGCGGAAAPSTSGPTQKDLPSIASSQTDRDIGVLAPKALKADGAAPLDKAIAAYFEGAATKRAYVMTDKPLYQPGETIWFRADLRQTSTLAGGAPLGLTFQLVSPRGAFVATKRVLLQNGFARNDLAIPDDLEGGEYKLKLIADDGTQDEKSIVINTYDPPKLQKSLELLRKAYGEGDTVAAAIEIKRGTGEPFANSKLTAIVTVDEVETARLSLDTDKDGKATAKFQLPAKIARGDGLLTILASDGGVTESIQKRIPIVMKALQLGMFPEGGDLVANVPGRVYFMAKTLIGKPADIEGKVLDDRNVEVATFSSAHDGMGRFELTPSPDRRYRMQITKPAGITQTYEVPAAKDGGCVVRSVDQKSPDKLRVAAICNTSREVVVEAVLREKRLGGGVIDVEAGKPALIELPADPNGQGVARITLFSARNEPLAERLVYHGLGADLRVAIKADRESYSPRDPVKLKIHAEANGKPVKANVAVAVVDETVLSFADDKSARILARMLLEPELGASATEPIEDPNYYFGKTAEAATAMDALLATRGYRRFEWRPVIANVKADPQPQPPKAPQGGQP